MMEPVREKMTNITREEYKEGGGGTVRIGITR